MNEKIKVTEGNSFILAIPLIAINAAGEESPIQVEDLTELVCRVYSPCGCEYGVSVSSIENRIFLQVPATMPRGVYNVDTTARRDEQRISLRLKDCFEIVAWDKQSNWQDYIIDGVVELPTQPTIIGAMNIDPTPIEEMLSEIKSDVDDVKMAVGTSSDTSVSTTVFGWLKAIRDFLVGIVTTNPYAKETTAQQAASDAAAAKTAAQAITGYATEANATSNKNAIIAEIQANAGIPTLTIPDSTAAQELAPNVLYIFDSRTSTLTLSLGTPIVGIANEYHFFVVCGSTAPTINFPSGISWNGGSAPTIAADKTYEVSILNNVAAYFEV